MAELRSHNSETLWILGEITVGIEKSQQETGAPTAQRSHRLFSDYFEKLKEQIGVHKKETLNSKAYNKINFKRHIKGFYRIRISINVLFLAYPFLLFLLTLPFSITTISPYVSSSIRAFERC